MAAPGQLRNLDWYKNPEHLTCFTPNELIQPECDGESDLNDSVVLLRPPTLSQRFKPVPVFALCVDDRLAIAFEQYSTFDKLTDGQPDPLHEVILAAIQRLQARPWITAGLTHRFVQRQWDIGAQETGEVV